MGAKQFTPTTEDVRALYVLATPAHRTTIAGGKAEFDRWLDQVKAEAKAEALEEAAHYAVEWVGVVGDGRMVDLQTETEYDDTAAWLRTRAEQIRGQA